MLTPIDVQGKTFKSGMGYSKADVDSFLTICMRIMHHYTEKIWTQR